LPEKYFNIILLSSSLFLEGCSSRVSIAWFLERTSKRGVVCLF